VDKYLEPVAGLGPFQQVDVPLVGTDNFDFMIEGVPNLIAIQSDANYASNYHAESDTFEKVDQYQVRLNSAIAAAVVWGFANDSDRLPRQTHDEVQTLIDSSDLEVRGGDMIKSGRWNTAMSTMTIGLLLVAQLAIAQQSVIDTCRNSSSDADRIACLCQTRIGTRS
jgi:hypothetical protein